MVLNKTLQELNVSGLELAQELGCQFLLDQKISQVVLRFCSFPGNQKPTFNFVLAFDSLNEISPRYVGLSAYYENYQLTSDLYTSPEDIKTFDKVEAILRDICSAEEQIAKIKPMPRKAPKGKLILTYDELNDFLYNNAARNNDMHADGDGYMVVTTYSNQDDDRSGIDIDLHFKIIDPIPGKEVKNNGEDATIYLVGANREANDHEWEKYSSKKIPTGKIKTLDDLLTMIRSQEQPKPRTSKNQG